jgi:hypothetical protein
VLSAPNVHPVADVQISNVIRAQVVLPGISGVPKDQYVTTWHFLAPGGFSEANRNEVSTRLISFFNDDPPGGNAGNVATHIGGQVNRAGCKIKMYDLGVAPGDREPEEVSWTLGAKSGSAGVDLPTEVALCASFYATINRPRRRGRVYVGPFHAGSVQAEGGDGRPSNALRLNLLEAAAWLALESGTCQLAVLSRADGVARAVTHGWVDNAFDTQRRRGLKSTLRTEFNS